MRFQVCLASLFSLFCGQGTLHAELTEWVRVSDDRSGFVSGDEATPFIAWGFNYDHDKEGDLLEDYWDEQWPKIIEDFREMKQLGANVVRIHLQFGRFMEAADRPNQHALDQLARLVALAEEVGLYLDVTGLGCYHKQDVPAWYDALSEADRWAAQAAFWEAVAGVCAESPAIFCYDLMNEPVVPGGAKRRDDWLGPAFAGKHFVQFIALERKGRTRHEIARAWIELLVEAIREVDQRHMITVGMVPWSLDRPGLSSGFVPGKVAGPLDFIAVHIYPENGKVEEALETLRGFDVGKPVVIEETFPLKCSPEELGTFFEASRPHADGWIGFYWGEQPDTSRPPASIQEAIMSGWIELFRTQNPNRPDKARSDAD